MLVVVSVFAVLGVILTYIIVNSLRGSGKSESTTNVRDELNYAINIMERQIRSAYEIDETIYECDSSAKKGVYFKDENDHIAYFLCKRTDDYVQYVASGSAELDSETAITSDEIDIKVCEFICSQDAKPNVPINVSIKLTGESVNQKGIEGAEATVQTKITLRN